MEGEGGVAAGEKIKKGKGKMSQLHQKRAKRP